MVYFRDTWRHAAAVASLMVFGYLSIATVAVHAQEDARAAAETVKKYSQHLNEIRTELDNLQKKIAETSEIIDRATDLRKSRTEVQALMENVDVALASVADNGTVAQLGRKALNSAKDTLNRIKTRRYSKSREQYLVDEWSRIVGETKKATDELEKARQTVLQILKRLQKDDDYLADLIHLEKGREALAAIKDLTNYLKETAVVLEYHVGQLAPPGQPGA